MIVVMVWLFGVSKNMSRLIRVSDLAYSKLDKMVENTGFSCQEIIDKAVATLEREMMLKQANEAYAMLRKDKTLWQEEQEEVALWGATLRDGLENE